MTSVFLPSCLSVLSRVSGPLSPVWPMPVTSAVAVARASVWAVRAFYRRRDRVLRAIAVAVVTAAVVTIAAFRLAVVWPTAALVLLARVVVWAVRAVHPDCRAARRRQREFEAWATPGPRAVEQADRALSALCAARGCSVEHFDPEIRQGFLDVAWARDRGVQQRLRDLCDTADLTVPVRKCLPDPDGAGGLKPGTVDRMRELWLVGWDARRAAELAEAAANTPAPDPAAEFQKWKRFGFVGALAVIGVCVFYAYPSATLAMAVVAVPFGGVLWLMKHLDGSKVRPSEEVKPADEPKEPYRRQVTPPRGWPV